MTHVILTDKLYVKGMLSLQHIHNSGEMAKCCDFLSLMLWVKWMSVGWVRMASI